jgi:hypothetical protein
MLVDGGRGAVLVCTQTVRVFDDRRRICQVRTAPFAPIASDAFPISSPPSITSLGPPNLPPYLLPASKAHLCNTGAQHADMGVLGRADGWREGGLVSSGA